MADDLDTITKLEIYKLVISRYRMMINEKESHSVSEIRQKVSPYTDFIKNLRERIINELPKYDYHSDFLTAVQKAISYVQRIHTCEFAFNFWVDFVEMDQLKIGTSMDKALLFAALLRSFESEDVRILVTKKGKVFVKFGWKTLSYFFVPESGSLLAGPDGLKIFTDDPLSYSFSDLAYENFEEQ